MTTFKDQQDTTDNTGRLTLAEILEILTAGEDMPLKFTAYDGSSAGPEDAELGLDLLTPRGTTYLATAPGEPLYERLGFAVLERVELPLPPDVLLPLARMSRNIASDDGTPR